MSRSPPRLCCAGACAPRAAWSAAELVPGLLDQVRSLLLPSAQGGQRDQAVAHLKLAKYAWVLDSA